MTESMTESTSPRLDAARWFAQEWAAAFMQTLAIQAGVKSRVEWPRGAEAAPASAIWWRQQFRIDSAVSVWIGTTEEMEPPTLLADSFSNMAWVLSEHCRTDVRCEAIEPSDAPPASAPRLALDVRLQTGAIWRVFLAFDPEFLQKLAEVEPVPESATASGGRKDFLLDLELPVSVSFGNVHMPLMDVARLGSGSVVELNRTVDEPVQILVNERVVALGEVVVVNGNYGVRIQRISAQKGSLCIS